jgi:hypothetical protein
MAGATSEFPAGANGKVQLEAHRHEKHISRKEDTH